MVPTTSASECGKAVLFCPACGHAARWDGDWRETARPHRPSCPECGTVLA